MKRHKTAINICTIHYDKWDDWTAWIFALQIWDQEKHKNPKNGSNGSNSLIRNNNLKSQSSDRTVPDVHVDIFLSP
ncbi:hypothetical protein AMTR_s00155p00082550 [Amborella trichopoda]|uniref:Uncharacterized protein n=1 Tax=Amborella trichopoda TaxID=13333 RepID=W1PKR5_AMBTC|nr:hypothetical protein AMTR_s00155p00082550 [Amborella trichopoda]